MNEPVEIVTSPAIPLPHADVDTDQIVPARHLLRTSRSGYAAVAFEAMRSDPSFPLDPQLARGARVLLAGPNFGCGSSREHAAWALHELGLRAVVAPSLADIFRQNCVSCGIVPVEISQEVSERLLARVRQHPATRVEVDVTQGVLRCWALPIEEEFDLHEDERHRLLAGLDPVSLTLDRHQDEIAAYEARRAPSMPRVEGRAP